MTNFNNVTGIGVGLNANLPKKEEKAEIKEKAAKEEVAKAPELKLMSGDEVLGLMAQQAALNKPEVGIAGYDVAKYVTPEQAKRIAGFVTSFEDIVAKNLEAVTAEFGNALSPEAKAELALKLTD